MTLCRKHCSWYQLAICFNFKKSITYLKGSKMEKSSIHQFTPQTFPKARARPARSQEYQTKSWFACGWLGANYLSLHLLPSQGVNWEEAGIWNEAILIWHACIQNNDLPTAFNPIRRKSLHWIYLFHFLDQLLKFNCGSRITPKVEGRLWAKA